MRQLEVSRFISTYVTHVRTHGLPSQRLRVRDVRRSELLTRYGEMPPCVAMAPGDLAREELLVRVRVRVRFRVS